MRRSHLALLSAALLLSIPTAGGAQQGPSGGAKPPAQRQAQPPRGLQLSAITLSGRYLAARVAEQDHDYDSAAEQIDLALGQAPNDPELVYAAFRLRMYAGRIDQAAQLAPQILTARPGDGPHLDGSG